MTDILNIDNITIEPTDDDRVIVYIDALIDNAYQLPATHLDPPEPIPALCETSIEFDSDDPELLTFSGSEIDIINLLDNLSPDWSVIPKDELT
jgi:hypothetical protein